jgi:hypothetical protein
VVEVGLLTDVGKGETPAFGGTEGGGEISTTKGGTVGTAPTGGGPLFVFGGGLTGGGPLFTPGGGATVGGALKASSAKTGYTKETLPKSKAIIRTKLMYFFILFIIPTFFL